MKIQKMLEDAGIKKKECEVCKGTGMEICDNPDHEFISAMPEDTGRLGCPCCGSDDLHRIPNTVCEECGGTGEVYNLAELNALSISIDEDNVKEKGIALVEEFFPKGECKERGKAVVLIASFLIYLANTDGIIKIETENGKRK